MSRFPPPIRYTVPGVLLVIGVLLQLGVLELELQRGRQRVVHSATNEMRLTGTLISANAETAFRIENTEGAAAIMGVLAGEPTVKNAVLVGANGVITDATQLVDEGRTLDQAGLTEVENLVAAARQTNAAQLQTFDNPSRIVGAFPVDLSRRVDDQIAILVTVRDLGPLLSAARTDATDRALLEGGALLAVCLIIFVLLRQIVIVRMSKLAHASHLLADGDYDARAALDGDDEIADLARTFNTMATSIQAQTAELSASAQRLSSLLGNLEDTVLVVGADGGVKYSNSASVEVIGVEPHELIGQALGGYLVVDDRAALDHALAAARAEPGSHLRIEATLDGAAPRRLEVVVSWPQHELLGGAVVNVRDITEKRSLEEQLRTRQKLELVGQLAGGVAHDFNNLLSVVCLNAEALLHDSRLSPLHRPAVGEILDSATRGGTLTRQLLTMGRRDISAKAPIDLNEVIRSIDALLHRLVPENIAFEIELAEQPCAVEANQGLLEQIVVNLVVNARDAMPDGGTLSVRTTASTVAGADRALVTISDTGTGIPRDIREQIFEPFFSTKPPGTGTGLGLTTVRGIVEDLAGTIELSTADGRGATFTISLPRLPSAAVDDDDDDGALSAYRGSERILYVEDEPAIRLSVQRFLSELGYEVSAFATAEEAVSAVAAPEFGVNLLLTDLMLPGMNGHALWHALRKERPGLPILFTSGYTEIAASRRQILEEGLPLLQKPVRRSTLARSIREVLASAAAAEPKPVARDGRRALLLVDDDEMVRRLSERIMEGAGYEVATAGSGDEACRRLAEAPESFAAALLDLNLPDTDGITLAGRLRRTTPSLPIVLTTGGDVQPPVCRARRWAHIGPAGQAVHR